MAKPVISVKSDSSIQEACEIMSKHDIGSLLVLNPDKTDSIITERDIVKAVAQGKTDGSVSEFTNGKSLITIDENANLGDAAQMMLSKKIRRLIVTGKQGQIVGIIGIRDLTLAVHESFLAIFEV